MSPRFSASFLFIFPFLLYARLRVRRRRFAGTLGSSRILGCGLGVCHFEGIVELQSDRGGTGRPIFDSFLLHLFRYALCHPSHGHEEEVISTLQCLGNI
ncbi:hypothetical protein F4821DRAFT_246620 [Hypoxylon rubiginosum]|uniref:Uncharacterized protein n=1 Tax=Hypoxylon rubiginosum TaxID=110542 RepID=A0ACC0CQJ2_9PEZI|nr:hypothetical protein F4821DRAFT_246620 [Hypoxylon rubiginosum]